MLISLPWLSILFVSFAFVIYISIIFLVVLGNIQAIRTIYRIYSTYRQIKNTDSTYNNEDTCSSSHKTLHLTDDDDVSTNNSNSNLHHSTHRHHKVDMCTDIIVPVIDDDDDKEGESNVALLPSSAAYVLSSFPQIPRRPTVSIIKPLKGNEENLVHCLESFFGIQYSQSFEIIFTIESMNDPAYPIAIDLMDRYPSIDARIILDYSSSTDKDTDTIGRSNVPIYYPRVITYPYPQNFPSFANPKVANCSKGVHYAKYDWILLSDSNVRAPVDYLVTLTDVLLRDTDKSIGLISSSIVGIHTSSVQDQIFTLGHQIELLMLNVHINRSVALCNALGIGIVSGKVIFFRKDLANNYSPERGFDALADYMAEDFMSGYWIRQQGYRIVLTSTYVEQHVPMSFTVRQCWDRHVRWGRLRKTITIIGTCLELLSNTFICGLLGAWAYMLYVNTTTTSSSSTDAGMTRTTDDDDGSISTWLEYVMTKVLPSLNWEPFSLFFLCHTSLWFTMDYCLYTLNYVTYDSSSTGIRSSSAGSGRNGTSMTNVVRHRIQPLTLKEIVQASIQTMVRIIQGYEYPFILVWFIKECCFGLPLWLSVVSSNTITWKETTVKIGKNTLIIPAK